VNNLSRVAPENEAAGSGTPGWGIFCMCYTRSYCLTWDRTQSAMGIWRSRTLPKKMGLVKVIGLALKLGLLRMRDKYSLKSSLIAVKFYP